MSSSGPSGIEAADLVEELASHCATLRESLAALRRVPSHEIEDALQRHLDAVGPLCRQIGATARQLELCHEGIHQLPPRARDELLSNARECSRVLDQAGGAYGELAQAVGDVLAAIRGKLQQIQRGGRMLRGYRRTAGLLG